MKDTGIKFETLHKGFNFKKIFIGLVVIVAIGSVIILRGSKANYTYEQIIPFAEGVVRIRKADLNLMAVNVQKTKGCTTKDTNCYETTTEVPSGNYKVNEEYSYCTVDDGTKDVEDTTIPMEYKEGKVYIGVNKKGTRCYIYLDIYEPPKTGLEIAQASNPQSMPKITGPACDKNTNSSGHTSDDKECTMHDKGIYTTQDDKGTSYVYRGTVNNNWVKFGTTGTQTGKGAPIWWRIIRINGDGSVRMIYAGTGATAPADSTGKWANSGTHAQLSETQGFAPKSTDVTCANNKSTGGYCYNDNAYVGYVYGDTGASTWANAHKNEHPSNVKKEIDAWYNTTNLSTLSTYLSDSAGFCGDRSSNTSDSAAPAQIGGYGTTTTYYGARYRNYTNTTPDLRCTYASNDLYTTDKASEGNKKLTYPIGLITADEVTLAGGYYGSSNYGYWLYTGSVYWTLSPFHFRNGYAYVFDVSSSGGLSSNPVGNTFGVRPVINLKADVSFTGNGTTSTPYEVS